MRQRAGAADRPLGSQAVNSLEDLERKIRERGVRVEERLELLRVLAETDAQATLAARQEELLAAVRAAASKLKGTAG
jgi:hypothetical protein